MNLHVAAIKLFFCNGMWMQLCAFIKTVLQRTQWRVTNDTPQSMCCIVFNNNWRK